MEKIKPLISVIVPVYKVELYLRQCVDSILIQTFSDIEVILVDDGSPDSCPQICDEYEKKDFRVKVIHKSNGGLSDARNVGLDYAIGEYVIFVDSDDFWYDKNCLKLLVEEIESTPNIDFICFNSLSLLKGKIKKDWIHYNDIIVHSLSKNEIIISLIKNGTLPMAAWSKVIRRSFLIENEIKFIKGIIGEDISWFLKILYTANSIRFVNLYMYVYRKGVSNSITNSFSEKAYNDLFSTLEREVSYIHKCIDATELKSALLSFMAYEFCILLALLKKIPRCKRGLKRKDLLKYEWLLNYTLNYKVKYCRYIRKFLGISGLEYLLGQYLKNWHV